MLAGVTAAAGDVVQVGKTIAWIVAPGEKPPVEAASAAPAARTMTEQAQRPSRSRQRRAVSSPRNVEVKVSPKARRMAQELGVDLSKVVGTGPGGTISGEDVQRAAEAQKAAPAPRRRGSAPRSAPSRA